ncbi:MAG TPA: hypothetical protein VHF24_05235 [Acidimicrobiales bacterium]|nr:hypothetical protein [Acidimicrobiales bacterium]
MPTVVDGAEGRVVDVGGAPGRVVVTEGRVVVVAGGRVVDVVLGTLVVVVGREGGGGSDGTGTSGTWGNGSCEQSSGSPVSPSTKLQ